MNHMDVVHYLKYLCEVAPQLTFKLESSELLVDPSVRGPCHFHVDDSEGRSTSAQCLTSVEIR